MLYLIWILKSPAPCGKVCLRTARVGTEMHTWEGAHGLKCIDALQMIAFWSGGLCVKFEIIKVGFYFKHEK